MSQKLQLQLALFAAQGLHVRQQAVDMIRMIRIRKGFDSHKGYRSYPRTERLFIFACP
jgi:hypothetical protein